MEIKDAVSDVCENYLEKLISLQNVNGIGLGYKYINGICTKELCLHILVKEKVPKQNLTSNNLIPKEFMGLKTDVIKVGKIVPREDKYVERVRPLKGGCSIGVERSGGSLGCIVTKMYKGKRQYFILSNNHVLAGANRFHIGSFAVQPEDKYNDGVDFSKVGFLAQFIPLKFKTDKNSPNNYVDCAIARITNKNIISNQIILVGKVSNIVEPTLGLKVRKVGKNTGLTTGEITTINAATQVSYLNNTKYAVFRDQIFSTLENGTGDSGSVILTEKNEVVGLLFAGSDTICAANKIKRVFDALKVELFTGWQ